MPDLKQTTDRLKELATQRDTPEGRKEARAALQSNREGIQALGAAVLGQWGGRDSVQDLKELLRSTYVKKQGHSLRRAVVTALRPCIEAEDASWVLDDYFDTLPELKKTDLLPLVVALPTNSLRERVRRELGSEKQWKRWAAIVVVGAIDEYPNRTVTLRNALKDPSIFVRAAAHGFRNPSSDAV